jgi:hypothetical protein
MSNSVRCGKDEYMTSQQPGSILTHFNQLFAEKGTAYEPIKFSVGSDLLYF